MDLVVWALLVLGVVLMALLAFVVLRHVRQLGRERAATTTDMTRRLARLQLLRATRDSRTR
ncbi:MAG: hypothetical protein H0X35_06675 [Pseudonocardiales bacterium]|nr:hypothetical protein [Pseudonocardiales bacterium]